MRLPAIHSKTQLVKLVNKVGFLPAFAGDIPGFSVEERVDPAYYEIWRLIG